MATQIKQARPGSPAWFVDTVEAAQGDPIMRIVDLDPILAKFILDVNVNNRSIRQIKVAQYAADMAAGNWAFNGEPIIIAKDGNLNDGQHRCLAVIEANASVKVAMLFGVERETRLTVDQGAMRSAGDFLGMDGVSNAALVAAIARMVIAYEECDGKSLAGAKNITSAQIRQRSFTDEAISTSATFGNTNAHYSRTFAAGSIIGFAHYIFSRVNREDAEIFLGRVCRGDNLRLRDPAHTLREKLLAVGRTSRERKIKLIIQAWNFHRRGMKVAASSMSDKLPFPALL